MDKKRQIAQRVAQLIADDETLLLDGGSTTYELAQLLVGKPLQIVTNSLPVATLFSASESADLILIGGNVHTRTGVTLGPYANRMLDELHVSDCSHQCSWNRRSRFVQQQFIVGGNRTSNVIRAAGRVTCGCRQYQVW